MSTTVTFAGNLTADPELRFTANKGMPVAEFRVLVNRRTQDAEGNWTDAEPTGHTCILYGKPAENIAESLRKGDRVLVHGSLYTEAWKTEAGENRTTTKVRVEEIGASLRWATLTIARQGAGE